MNTIIWIGLFMFIMGTIILVSSYQSIFNQSAKAGGIIAALCIYLLLDGVAVMLWGNHNYIIAFFIGGLGLLLSVMILIDVIKSRNKSDDEYRKKVEDDANMRPVKVSKVEQDGVSVRVYMKVYRGENISSGKITFLTQSGIYKEGDMWKVLYPGIVAFHPGLEKEFSSNRLVDITGVDETFFNKLSAVEHLLIGNVV